MKTARILLVLFLAALLLVGLAALVVVAQAGGTKYYDGTCGEDLNHAYCYGGYAGVDFAAPVSLKEVFTPTLPVITIRVAANGYLLDRTLALLLMDGSSAIASWGLDVKAGQTIVFEVEASGLYAKSYSLVVSGGGPSWVEWIEVGPVEGGYSEPEPPPAVPCINDDPDLESAGADWIDIGDPEWVTTTVLLDQYEGIQQEIYLYPGAYELQIGYVTGEHEQTMPITASLGITGTEQHVLMNLGGAFVPFVIIDAGTYTITVISDFAHPEDVLELTWVCLRSVTCINEDHNLQIGMPDWYEINTPIWLTSTNGVLLDYNDGIAQGVVVPAGNYRLEISATLTPGFPEDRAFVEMCLNDSCAMSPVLTATNTVAQFTVLNTGAYNLSVINASTSRIFPTSTMTLTYVCLMPLINDCVVLDPDLDAVHRPVAAGEQGWLTVYDSVSADGGALLARDTSVSQWLYLSEGVYTMTIHAHSDFSNFSIVQGIQVPVSATLTVRLKPWVEFGDSTWYDYQTHLVRIHSIYDDDFPDPDQNRVYTTTLTVEKAGNWNIELGNYACTSGAMGLTCGYIWIDYVCLNDEVIGLGPRVGQCPSLVDAGFSEYQAAHWDKSAGVDWSPGYVTLGQGAAISQTVLYSNTEEMTNTTWIVYAVARSSYTSTLSLGLGVSNELIDVVRSSDFRIYTATITSSMPVSVSVAVVTGTADIDFVCVYDPDSLPTGEWSNGADGDTECVEPPIFDWSSLTWNVIDAVARIMQYIWVWIVYLVCLMVLWMQRIWLAIVNFAKNLVVSLGLDVFWQTLIAWINSLIPYDTIRIVAYVIGLLFGLTVRMFGLLGFVTNAVLLFLSSIFFGLRFAVALIGAAWRALAVPCSALPLHVPDAVVYGFLLAVNAIKAIPVITYAEYMLIGWLSLKLVFWIIAMFSLGGGE